MAAEVKMPTLTTDEHRLIVTALEHFANISASQRQDVSLDIAHRNKARAVEATCKLLLEKIK